MAEKDLKLSVGLETGDAREDAKALAREVEKALKSTPDSQNSKVANLDKDLVKSVESAKKLSTELDNIARKEIPTDAYKQKNAELDKMNTKWENLLTREERYIDLGKTPPKALTHDIETAAENAHRLEAELQDIVNSGKAFTLGKDTDEFRKKESQLNDINNRLRVQLLRHQENTQEIKKQPPAMNKLKESVAGTINTISKMGNGVKSISTKAAQLGMSIKNAVLHWTSHRHEINRNNDMIKHLIRNILKYGLGIRSVYMLVRKLRAAISEGVTNLVQWNGGLNSTNAAVSRLKSSVLYLKNALGSLASPIIQLVTPALESLMDRLARVANMIAQIIGALTGKSTITVAKKTSVNAAGTNDSSSKQKDAYEKAQERYEKAKKKAEEKYQKQLKAVEEKRAKAAAKAEEKQAKAAAKLAAAQEEVNEALGAYDKLNIINTKDTQDLIDDMEDLADLYDDPVMDEVNPEDFFGDLADAGGSALANMFEEVPISNIAKEWADKIKAVLADLVYPIKQAWDNTKDYVISSWKRAVDSLKKLAGTIWDDFIKVWKEQATVKIFEDIFKTIGHMGELVANLADRFREAWENNDNGLKILRNIRDLFGIVTSKIEYLSGKTAEWAAQLDFNPLLEKTGELLDSMKKPVQFIADVLGDFYETVILPLTTWLVEKGIPELEQAFIDFNNKVDWESLRKSLQELWKHLEPFAEKVGEGLILFIKDVSNALAKFLNSKEFKDFLKSVADWMDKVKPEDVAKGLKAIAIAILAFKFASFVGPGFTGFMTFMALLSKPIGALGSLAMKLMGIGQAAEAAGAGVASAAAEAETAATGMTALGAASTYSAAGMIGAVGLSLELGQTVSVLSERMQGGNEITTEYGGALHSLTQELTENGKISDEQSQKLYRQIEAWESAGYSGSEASTLFMNSLKDMNVSVEDASTAIGNLAGQNAITEGSYQTLQTEVQRLQTSTQTSTESNLKNVTSYEELYKAVQQTANDMRLTDNQLGTLNTSMINADGTSKTLEDAYESLIEATKLAGIDTKEFSNKLGVTLPRDAKKTDSSLTTSARNEAKLGEEGKKAGEKIKSGMTVGGNAIDRTGKLAESTGNRTESGMNRASSSTEKFERTVDRATDNVDRELRDTSQNASRWGRDLIGNFIDGINDRIGRLRDKVREMAELVESYIGFSEPDKGPLANFHTFAPDMIDLFIKGLKENENRLAEQMTESFDIKDKMTNAMQHMNIKDFTIPDIAVGKVIPTSMSINNAGGGNNAGNNRIEQLLTRLLEAIENSDNSNNPTVQLTLDKRTVAEAVWDEEEKRYRQLGYT